jgi:hypothetical protein
MVQLTEFFEGLFGSGTKKAVQKGVVTDLVETSLEPDSSEIEDRYSKDYLKDLETFSKEASSRKPIYHNLMENQKTRDLFFGDGVKWQDVVNKTEGLTEQDFKNYRGRRSEFDSEYKNFENEQANKAAEADKNKFRTYVYNGLINAGLEPTTAKFYSNVSDFVPLYGDASGFEDAIVSYRDGQKTAAALQALLATVGLAPVAGDIIKKTMSPFIKSLKGPEVATAGGPRLSAVDNQTEELLSNKSEMLIGPKGSGVDEQVSKTPWELNVEKIINKKDSSDSMLGILKQGFKETALIPVVLAKEFKNWANTVPNPKLVKEWQPKWEASVNEWTPFINDLAKKDGFDATGKTLLDIKNLSPENQQLAINKLDEIWQKYGVTFGANGKFIREIDDSKASWDLSKLGYRLDNSGNLRVKAGLEFEPLDKSISLGELMKHDELYEAYPWLKNVRVNFIDDRMHMRLDPSIPNFKSLGTANPNNYEIELSSKALKKINSSKTFKTPTSTLLHEIQHLIQFAEKSNVELNQEKIIKSYLNKAKLHNKRVDILKNKISKLSPGKERDLLEEKLISEQLAAITSSFKGRGKYVYRNLWSEIEANNAADRIWYKAKVKKDKSPWSTLKQSYALSGSRAELLQLAFTKTDGTFDAKGYVKHMNKLEDMMINSGMVKEDIASQLYEVDVAKSFKATKSPDDISIEYDDLIYDALEKKLVNEGIIENRLEMDKIFNNVFNPKSSKQVNPEKPTFEYDINKVETGDKSKSGLMSRSISASEETFAPSTNTAGAGEIGTNPYNVDVDRLKNYNSQQLRETDELVTKGGNSTAGSEAQTAKINAPIEEGSVISARLNLRSKIDSSLPETPDNRLQTVHPVNKSGDPDYGASESYKTFVTVENGRFDVDQKKRKNIATTRIVKGEEKEGLKIPAASITGTYTTSRNVLEEMDDTVVEIGINPAITHLFVDMKTGQAVKDFEIATAFRDRVYAKGVTYWKKTDAPKALGNVTNETRYAFKKGGLMSRSI